MLDQQKFFSTSCHGDSRLTSQPLLVILQPECQSCHLYSPATSVPYSRMPADLEACVTALQGKADNAYALCNWMKDQGKGYFSAHSPGDQKEIDAAVAEYHKLMKESQETTLIDLVEYVAGSTPLKVDREQGILYRCKILGEQSVNQPPHNNVYPKATRERAIPLLEGARAYENHAPAGQDGRTRPYSEGIGVHRNVREEGDGLYSDFHFPPKHRLAEQILWDAANAPHALGFSIATRGKKELRNGQQIVEEIVFDRSTHSIDLVSRPATTRGLFESRQPVSTSPDTAAAKTLKEVVQGLPPNSKVARYLSAVLEMDAAVGDMPTDVAGEMPGATGPDDALKSGFKSAMVAAIEAFIAGELASADMIAKIKEMAKMHDKAMGVGAAAEVPANGSSESGEETAEEAINSLRKELAIRDQIEEAALKFAKPEARRAFVKSLLPLGDDDRKALIEERKTQQPKGAVVVPAVNTPRSAAPSTAGAGSSGGTLAEQRQGATPQVPQDSKARAAWLCAN